MVIKHSTVHNPNEIVPSADWNANHTGTATPEAHTHIEADITDLEHNAVKIQSKDVDVPLVGDDGKVLTYDHALSKYKHTSAGVGDMTKAVYDTDDDGIVDKAENVDDGVGNASTAADVKDAVTKKHTQGTDTTLGNMTAAINMNTHKINNVVDPALDQDAATKKYVDDAPAGLWEVDGTETQLIIADEIDMQTKKIINVVDPTANQDAATKKWVEDQIPGVGTSYWSCAGANFHATIPDTKPVEVEEFTGLMEAKGNGIFFVAPVSLPHGAVITAITVYGNAPATAETYLLYRNNFAAGAADTMATANIGTEDNTISNATIDNSAYIYWIATSSLDGGDRIYGARITYTL